MLNTRRQIKGHYLVGIGGVDRVLTHPREVYRLAIAACASALVLVHNHPSGDPSPSDQDVATTAILIACGLFIKIDPLDSIVIGDPGFTSMRALGYFVGNDDYYKIGQRGVLKEGEQEG